MGDAARELQSIGWVCVCRKRALAPTRPDFCPYCGSTNSYTMDASSPATTETPTLAKPSPGGEWASQVEPEQVERARSGWRPWAHVTSELPRRHVTLVGGPKGTGKTTMLLYVAGGVVRESGRCVLYGCGEQRPATVRHMASSMVGLGDELARIWLHAERDLERVAERARELRPVLIVLDALKRYRLGGFELRPGSRAERDATNMLAALAHELDAAVVAVLHMRACGRKYSVGSAPLQASDVIVRFDRIAEPVSALALRCDGKNRYGADDRVAYLRRNDVGGLDEVSP